MLYLPAIVVGRFARFAIRLFRPGGGSALPGLILSKIAPKLLAKTLRSFSSGVVIISGSAGKSTTTKMVVALARAHGLEVFTNPSTANIRQGFYSSIIEKSNLFARVKADIAILEIDESHADSISREVSPRIVTLLNVLEDQLDRFIDPALVRDSLQNVAVRATQKVLMNADDQNLLLLAKSANMNNVEWFGIYSEVAGSSNLGVAPTYQDAEPRPAHLVAEVFNLVSLRCSVRIAQREAIFDLPNRGLHYALDAVAALATAREILGERFELELCEKVLSELPPVFARGEVVEVDGQKIEFVLVQNPTSFQLNLDNLSDPVECLMIAIGRDVHDPSWLWTVNLSRLNRVDVVSGYNAAEMALRLAYENVSIGHVDDDLFESFTRFLALPAPANSVKTVVFSADAMRRLRRHLGFTSPEEVER
jgi:UDP-N-acetylmuramoylalanine-D-glutamate ligase